ncbi:hypothetical protein Q5P01_021242 [Channa striata]|uniref:Uncharacterized protein n=1 Tax=Channa striata TaxID=64152 RepID=A0AA88LUL9_CHASR|nr:hypothetical protein Q5P01_021242 [Channa striata]
MESKPGSDNRTGSCSAKSLLLCQIITWTGYSDGARGADNGHCHGPSARAAAAAKNVNYRVHDKVRQAQERKTF